MDKVLSEVYRSLDMVVFERTEDERFKTLSATPEWLMFFLQENGTDNGYRLADIFPYLSCFMEDAEQHWHAKNERPIHSGSWLEMDENRRELPLEASALSLEGRSLLLLQNLGDRYVTEVERLQHIRDGLLSNELLENEVRKRTLQVRKREEDIAIRLVSLTSFRDEETGTHVRRIGLYAAAMAKALEWKPIEIDNIRVAAPMHDIGKIGIPDSILRKKGVLNDEEFNVMKRHTEIGATMLSGTRIPIMDMAAQIALNHHERWDGTGYPSGLAGEEIPIAARITTIVDIYDALVHERVYKKAIPEDEALAIMTDMSGRHLDPHLFKVFLYLLPVMRQIRTEVKEEKDKVVV